MADPQSGASASAAADPRITSRLIAGEDGGPALEFVEAAPSGPSDDPPILFIHGAFGGAWMWRETFMPALADRGRFSAAFSFRGHGASEGFDRLRHVTLKDYVTDTRRVLAQMAEPPVVVAHSLGGLVAQILIGQEPIRALVLLASLPPEGMLFMGPRLAVMEPVIWTEAFMGSTTKNKQPVEMLGFQLLFSDGVSQERIARYASLMTPESPRALMDAHVPPPVLSALAFSIPTLVLGGARDRLIWRASTVRTAFYHGGEHHTLPSVGHFLQLDDGADTVAERIATWLEKKGA